MFRRFMARLCGDPDATRIAAPKFAAHDASQQAMIDIFKGNWATDLSDIAPGVVSGPTRLFDDPRTRFPLVHFASPRGDLAGQRVLELGPMEGAQTYQLEQLGADVTSIEADTAAYLKGLIVKELTGVRRARLLYGDCISYLQNTPERYDMVFCCGLLYEMADPVELIDLLGRCTNRVFVWTHYFSPGAPGQDRVRQVTTAKGGRPYTYYQTPHGSGRPVTSLMSREDILSAFSARGFVNNDVHQEEPDHPGGPAFSVSFWR